MTNDWKQIYPKMITGESSKLKTKKQFLALDDEHKWYYYNTFSNFKKRMAQVISEALLENNYLKRRVLILERKVKHYEKMFSRRNYGFTSNLGKTSQERSHEM